MNHKSSNENRFWLGWVWFGSVAVIICATWFAYSNSLRGPFLFDDVLRIVNDPHIRTAWPPWTVIESTNRPLAMFTVALNYAVHQQEVFGYHLVNLLIHILAALTLMGLVRRGWLQYKAGATDQSPGQSLPSAGTHQLQAQLQAQGLGLAVGLLWALHPLNTQAVSYIIQRVESIMALFYLLTLYGFVRAQQSPRRWGWYLFSIVCCALGMACKEVMVTAPLVVLWYDRAQVAKSWRQLFTERWGYYLLLSATWGVLAWSMLHYQAEYRSGALLSVKGLTPWIYLINQSAVITHYLRLAFFPVGQCAYYAWPIESSIVQLAPYLLFIVALLCAALWLVIRRPALGFVAMSFFIILAPTSSIAPIIDLAFEHRVYLPLAAIVTLVCVAIGQSLGLLGQSPPSRRAICLAVGLVVLAGSILGTVTHARNAVYGSEEAFWTDVTHKAPNNAGGWVGLGTLLAKQHKLDEAEACFRQALQLAPEEARPHAVYAGLLISQGNYTEAAEVLDRATQIDPNHAEVVINTGLLFSLTGKFAEAQPFLEAGVRSAPDDEELQTNLIVNLCALGQVDRALEVAQANMQNRPSSARAANDVAACMLATGDALSAQELAHQAIALDPTLARAHATLGMAVSNQDPPAARQHLQRACELEPSSFEFLSALANLTMLEDPAAAIPLYQKVLAVRPNESENKLRLAMAYDACGEPEKAIPLLEQVLLQNPDLIPVRNYLRSLRGR